VKNPGNLFLTYTQRSDCNKKVLGFEEKKSNPWNNWNIELSTWHPDCKNITKIEKIFLTLKLVTYVLLIIPHVWSW